MPRTIGAREKEKSLAMAQTAGAEALCPSERGRHLASNPMEAEAFHQVSLSCPAWLRIHTRGLWKLAGSEKARTVEDVPILSKPCLVTKGVPETAWSTHTPSSSSRLPWLCGGIHRTF